MTRLAPFARELLTGIPLYLIQNICAPEPDQNLTVTYYERTAEQNDQLGLTDMKTENYGEDN
jgi:hypothetical protein